MGSPWKTEKWWVSHYNYSDELKKGLQCPKKVVINETTLRDGIGQVGVSINIKQAIRMAELLDELGVPQIEVSYLPGIEAFFPGTKAGPLEEIAKKNLRSELWTCVDCAKLEHIEIASQCGAKGVYIETQIMQEKLMPYYGWTEEDLIENMLKSTHFAKRKGLKTSVFLVESTRADKAFLKRILSLLETDSNTDRVTLADTFGGASQHGMGLLVRVVKESLTKPIEVHCHNDFGLALANAISSVAAGASIVHTTLNGMGERCGNVATEELAVALLTCYGIDTGIHYEKLFKISKEFQKICKFKASPTKPIVGSKIFLYESPLATRAYIKLQRSTVYEPFLVGQKHTVYLGQKTHEYSIKAKLKQLGISVEENKIQELLRRALDSAVRKQKALSDREFKKIVNSVNSL